MATEVFRRPPRRPPPAPPHGEIVLAAPPELPEPTGGGLGQALILLPMLAGAGSTALLVSGSGGSPLTYVASGMMALSMGGMAVGSMGRSSGEKRRRLDSARRDYQRDLDRVRTRVRAAADQQRRAALWRHPDPSALWCIAAGSRLWERRPADDDHLVVRVGRGPQRLAAGLVAAEAKPIEDLEPISAGALRGFVRTHSAVPDLPLTVALPTVGRLALDGPPDAVRALARAIVAQVAAFHPAEDVLVAVCADPAVLPAWQWLKWLPHALSPTAVDAVGPVRLIGDDLLEIEATLGDLLSTRPRFGSRPTASGPHLLLVIDGGRVAPEAQVADALVQGVTVLDLNGSSAARPGDGVLRIEVSGEPSPPHRGRGRGAGPVGLSLAMTPGSTVGVPDALSEIEAETLARHLAPWRLSTEAAPSGNALSADLSLPDLLRIGDPHRLDVASAWRSRAPRERLRVPIGVGPGGRPVELDIKESAQGGMGPHGLVIGATGSGKSELLRTLVLGLAITHSSEVLNFVLVDFKGGATFASLDALPHTSAVITNLEDELILVDRMRDAVQGELVRRQEVLRAAGNFASVRDYERAREQGAALDPMPSLFIVVDEFSELLSAKPDFIDLFVMIGRLGRSLGVHLLLASQRLEEGRLRGLDTHLSYRVGLRTFSATESRVVLGVPDAYELPSAPGHAYLKESTDGLARFRAAYVSGAYRRADGVVEAVDGPTAMQIRPYPIGYLAPRHSPTVPDSSPVPTGGDGESLLDVLVDRLSGAGPRARQVWLPPLGRSPSLDALLPAVGGTGRDVVGDAGRPVLSAPVGLIDRPFDQRRDPHWVELASAHFVVVGRPQSGKSTLLRTLIAGLAVTHTAQQVQFYCLDFGGGTLTGLADLPHVGAVATRLEPDLLRRTIAEVNGLLAAREQWFTAHRIDSMSTYRRMVAAGTVPSDGFGDVVLVVDGWGTVRADYEELDAAITQIAARGLGFGVHVVLSIQRWMELRPALRDLISARLELRLGDPSESDVDRRAATNVPETAPGRGVVPEKLHFLAALPRIDGRSTTDDLVDGVADLVARVSAAWTGPGAPRVRLLPDRLAYNALPAPPVPGGAVPIGIEERALGPVFADFDAEPHFLVIGDVQSGKSNLLRVIARGITDRWSPAEARVITFDYRRGLVGAVPASHQLGYVMNTVAAPGVVSDIAAALRQRLGGIEVGAGGHVSRWTGARLFLIVDDYELLAGSSGNPLTQLAEFLPQARDIGLHVVVARSSGGAGQGMYEPVLRSLRELGTPGVLLSGAKDEGPIIGTARLETLPAGRGRLVHRRLGSVLIQTADLTRPL